MGKLLPASEAIEKKAQKIAMEIGLMASGASLMVFNTTKAKEVTKVAKAPQIAEVLTNEENIIVLINYERAFDKVDEQTQEFWLRAALNKAQYNLEKDKVELIDDVRNIISLSKTYNDVALQKIELGLLTIEQIMDEDRQAKLEAAEMKKKRKK